MKTPRAILNTLAGKMRRGFPDCEYGEAFLGYALALALITLGGGLPEEAEAGSSEFVSAAFDPCLQPPLDWHEKYFLAQTNDSPMYGPSPVAPTATDANTGEQKVFGPWDFGAVEWRAPDGH